MAARGATSALPIAAICCLGIILLAIASTIVLALIPVYLTRRNAHCSKTNTQSTATYTVPISPSQPAGSLTSSQTSQVNTLLQNSQTTSSTSCAGFNVRNASIGGSGRRKRQLGGFLILVIFFFGSSRGALRTVQRLLIAYLLAQVALINALIQSFFSNSATTTSSAVVSTTPSSSGSTASGRRRRNILLRRQAYQAPSELAAANTYKD